MLSISIRYGGKLNYAMRALGPMLGSNSSQTETALSQMLGHDGASRHTLLSKMLRHNSTRTQNHSDISIGLRQRSCAAACDMFLGKNHGSHFITIKSIGKTHHPVPLRFAVNGSASARYASLPSTSATTGGTMAIAFDKPPASRGGRAARQRHAARDNRAARQRYTARNGRAARQTLQCRGGNGIRARTCSCSARFAAIRINGDTGTRNPTAQHCPEPHGTEGASWRGQSSRTIIIFRSPVQPTGPRRSIFEAHSRTGEGPHSWTKRFRDPFRTDEGAPFE